MSPRSRTALNTAFCAALLGALYLMWRGLEALVMGNGAGLHGLADLGGGLVLLLVLAAAGVRAAPGARERS